MEFVDGISLKALLAARRAANGGVADPLPGGAGDRLRARDPARAGLPAPHGAALLRHEARQRHPDAGLAEAHRPRRGAIASATREPGLRHGRLPGAGDRAGRAVRRLGPLHRRAHARGAVHRLRGPAVDDALHAAGAARLRAASTLRLAVPAAVPRHGARSRPTASNRPTRWPSSCSACCARSSPTRRARPCRRAARSSPPTCARGPTARTAGCCPRCASRPTTRPPATSPRSPPSTRRSSSARCAGRPERTVEVDLRLAQALITARRVRRGGRAARRDRTARSVGVARALVSRRRGACPEDAARGDRELRARLPRAAGRACAEARARRLRRAGEPAGGGRRVVRDRLAHGPELHDGDVRARPLPAGVRRARSGARGVRAGAGVLDRLRRGADGPDRLPAERGAEHRRAARRRRQHRRARRSTASSTSG